MPAADPLDRQAGLLSGRKSCAWWRILYSQVRGKTGACALLDIARNIDA